MLKLASDGIISFSTKPLKLVGALGMVSIVISIVLLIYALISYACHLHNLSAGWTSIMVAITFFSGIQLLSIWIIAEYIGRIYDETVLCLLCKMEHILEYLHLIFLLPIMKSIKKIKKNSMYSNNYYYISIRFECMKV